MSGFLLVRHAEPKVDSRAPASDWRLTERGRADASALGAALDARSTISVIWTSSERKAHETALLVAPDVAPVVRDELIEVRRPWYVDTVELRAATSAYLSGGHVEGWETQGEVLDRLAAVRDELPHTGSVVVVSHGVLITMWLASEVGLEDPFAFCMGLRMPDAWSVQLGTRSLVRA